VCEAEFDYLDGVSAWVVAELRAAEAGLAEVVVLRAYSSVAEVAWFQCMLFVGAWDLRRWVQLHGDRSSVPLAAALVAKPVKS
jgi:hypothetical protein